MKTYSPVEVLTGHADGLTEPRNIGCEHDGCTKGHRDDQGGLRGHSVGDTYPWRVVGFGDGSWGVEGLDGRSVGRWADDQDGCTRAHRAARHMKILHPSGYVENGPHGPVNIGGAPDGIPARLAGHTIVVWSEYGSRASYRVSTEQSGVEPNGVPLLETTNEDGERQLVSVLWLAYSQHIGVTIAH